MEGFPNSWEHMFEKVVTPSDVGKLNRLVIPKQHAEKYFPLGPTTTDNKGLHLSFEDSSGKWWVFRYSYWSSSQSYVITKGWSRFVKDKALLAGDIVSFHRRGGGGDRLFIDWRRRPINLPYSPPPHFYYHNSYYLGFQDYVINSAPKQIVESVPAAGNNKLRLFGVDIQHPTT